MSTYATRDDEHVMRILSGATFGPNARVTLPSGKVMDAAREGIRLGQAMILPRRE